MNPPPDLHLPGGGIGAKPAMPGVVGWISRRLVAPALIGLLICGSSAFADGTNQTASAKAPAKTAAGTTQTTPAEEDIRDIRGPVHLAYPWLWIVYVLAALVAAGLLAAAWRAWKRRPKVKVKTAHELALERLQRALGLMTPEQVREFCIAVSDAIRLYIEDRFQARAARRTTEEFLYGLLADPSAPLAQHSALLEDFLKHCDMAKFGRWAFSLTEMQAMHASARRFVEETQPRDETRNRQRPPTVPPGPENARPGVPPLLLSGGAANRGAMKGA